MLMSENYIAVPPGATIKEQLEERGWTQKLFAAKMQMSEKHISRLINGKVMLTYETANKLEQVLGIPAKFWNGLEAAYQEDLLKVKAENIQNISKLQNKEDKYSACDIAEWLLWYNAEQQKKNPDVEGISNLKLQKLLYYAQGISFRLRGKKVFSDSLVAWQHGPVVIAVYEKYKQFHADDISVVIDMPVTFSSDVVEVLQTVYVKFARYTAWALREKTHKETPWLETKLKHVISLDSIESYFKEQVEL